MRARFLKTSVLMGFCFLISSAGVGQVWVEAEDARGAVDAPQVTRGAGPLVRIEGVTEPGDDRDSYCVKVIDPAVFSVTADPGVDSRARSEFGTRLYLFGRHGTPVLASGVSGSTLVGSGSLLRQPGEYVLVVTGSSGGPLDSEGVELFDGGAAPAAARGPRAGSGALARWHPPSDFGSYSLALSGAGHCQRAGAGGHLDYVSQKTDLNFCLGVGDGLFECDTFASGPGGSGGNDVGFIDGDAHLDAVFSSSFNESLVCLGDGAGGFEPCLEVAAIPGSVTGVELGDLDGDQVLDLYFSVFDDHNQTCLGNGDGTFAPCVDASPDQRSTSGLALGFMDGDSILDVVLASSLARNQICLGQGDGTFLCGNAPPGSEGTWDVALGFVNGDSNLDAVFARRNSDLPEACLGDGAGGFSSCAEVSLALTADRVALGHLDADDNLDAVFTHTLLGLGQACRGAGDGTFMACVGLANSQSANGLDLGFIDDDSNLDALVTSAGSTQFDRYCAGNGAGGFVACQPVDGGSTSSGSGTLGEFGGSDIFSDGFESGDTSIWSVTVP
jgi:hypothetical protein